MIFVKARKERSCEGVRYQCVMGIIIVKLFQQMGPSNATDASPLLDCVDDPAEANGYLNVNLMQGVDASASRLLPMQTVMPIGQAHANHQLMTDNELVEISQSDMRMVLMNQTLLKER